MSERKKKVKADSQLTVVRRCELLDVAAFHSVLRGGSSFRR